MVNFLSNIISPKEQSGKSRAGKSNQFSIFNRSVVSRLYRIRAERSECIKDKLSDSIELDFI